MPKTLFERMSEAARQTADDQSMLPIGGSIVARMQKALHIIINVKGHTPRAFYLVEADWNELIRLTLRDRCPEVGPDDFKFSGVPVRRRMAAKGGSQIYSNRGVPTNLPAR